MAIFGIDYNDWINDPEKFQVLIRKLSPEFTEPRYQNFLTPSFSRTREWKAVKGVIGRVPMASLIDVNSGKPIIGTEKPVDLRGDMPTFGNKVTFSQAEFDRMDEIIYGINNGFTDPSELIEYIFNYMERLVIGPHITMDKLFFEALSNGTSTILASENLAKIGTQVDWGIKKSYCSTLWGTSGSADGFADLKKFYKTARDTYGIRFTKFMMNENTFDDFIAQDSVVDKISRELKFGNKTTKYDGFVSREAVNQVLMDAFGLPPIEIQNYQVSRYTTSNDTTTGEGIGASIAETSMAFEDGRVAGVMGDVQGKLIYTSAAEQKRPDPGVTYAVERGVLISKRTKRGAVTFESEYNAIPVPSMLDQIQILVTDATSA